MSQLNANDTSKEDHTQMVYNIEQFCKPQVDGSVREGRSSKKLEDKNSLAAAQQFQLNESWHSKGQAFESMKSVSSGPRAQAVTSTAVGYTHGATLPHPSVSSPLKELYGQPLVQNSQHHSQAASYRHLMPHSTLVPNQYGNSSEHPSRINLDAMWQQKLNSSPWIFNNDEARLDRERILYGETQERLDSHKEGKSEKERQREWREKEQERLEREERERAQREAVQQHFEESLRLALQKQKNINWKSQSGSKGPTGKSLDSSSMNMQSTPSVRSSESDRIRETEKERFQVDNNNSRREHERWLAIVQQQRNEQTTNSPHLQNFSATERQFRRSSKTEVPQMICQGSSKLNLPSDAIGSSASQTKNETNFSLYGYQPFQHSYITHAQLKAREESKDSTSLQSARLTSEVVKGNVLNKKEKDVFLERPLTPNSSHHASQTSRVSINAAYGVQDRIGVMHQPVVGSGGAFKPYEYSSNSNSPAPPAHQNAPLVTGRTTVPHYLPLQDQPQNLVVGDGKGYQEKVLQTHKYSQKDKSPALSNFSPQYTVSKSTSPAISSNNQYSYSLIQQGLVPNPLYIASHSGSGSGSTTPVSYMLSHPSKLSTHPTSPPVPHPHPQSNQNPGVISTSTICRPNSAPYTLNTSRTTRSFSPIGYSTNSSSTKLTGSDENSQVLCHKSLSPTNLTIIQSNESDHNSPHRTPHLNNVPSHSPSLIAGENVISKSFHSSVHSENLESSAIPLVKRKLLSQELSRKRARTVDDSLLPPQLHPQVQTTCQGDIRVATPPNLISDVSLFPEKNLAGNAYSVSNDGGRSISLIPKLEPDVIPLSMPDICSRSPPIIRMEIDTKLEDSSITPVCIASSVNFQMSSTIDFTAIESASDDQSLSNTEKKSLDLYSDEKESASNPNLTSSSNSNNFHPKLKKAWLQRHSENEDKKYFNDDIPLTKELHFKPKKDLLSETETNHFKGEPSVENIACDNPTLHCETSCNVKTDEPEHKLKIDEDSSFSSDSDAEIQSIKHNKKPSSKYSSDVESQHKRIKNENTEACAKDDISSPRKETKKKSSYQVKDLRRKGRKSKNRSIADENAKTKKFSKTVVIAAKPPEKPSISQLRKTGESFLQDSSCFEIAPRLPKCRECRMASHQRKSSKKTFDFCRFYFYRKLRYGKNGTILSAGFSEPTDALNEDMKLWLPPIDVPPLEFEIETSKFLLTHVGDQFCDLVEMEREAQKMHMSTDEVITWKRVMESVREMCDVCDTTLFNIHWVCHKCGFSVCIDCYKTRKTRQLKGQSISKDRDEGQWLFCTNKQPHEQEKLMLTQIIAGTALWDVGKTLHEIRRKWNIPTYCNCGMNDSDQEAKNSSNGICKLMSAVTKCFSSDKESCRDGNSSADHQKAGKKAKASHNGLLKPEDSVGEYSSESGGSPLSWLADVALNSSKIPDDQKEKEDDLKLSEKVEEGNVDISSESDDDKNENFSTLRELLIRPTGKMGGKNNGSSSSSQKTLTSTLDEVISCVIEQKVRKSDKSKEKQLLHFSRRCQLSKSGRELPPVRTCLLAESSLLYPEIPHLWLGSGKILLLKDPYDAGNLQMFQEQWKRGQPVIIADVGKRLDQSLWTPESFIKEFGDNKTDFIDCLCGTLVQNQPLKKFWEGFENINRRVKDDDGNALVLKLVDWPPADFAEIFPSRYEDLMKALPLPQYTHPEGIYNMASRLPQCFIQPDLGPRMYNAYGLSSSHKKGSTNLHLDTSDAVNLLVYTAVMRDGKEGLTETLKALDDCGCDALMKKRAKGKNSKPGAIWHVYNSRDADKIRDFLNKVSEEQGVKRNPHHDPIHNQEWYLDELLRSRLHNEYGVEPYTIAQCLGDAIFIPAGSPHQVVNLNSCVKVSEDFISPESIGHSFFLTQEIRSLSDSPVNSDGRLQIKNIIYHAVKDALALLQSHDPEESKTQMQAFR